MHKTVLAFAAALAVAAPASASSTRVATLGGMNAFIVDDANVWTYPHLVERNTHLFQLDYASCMTGTLQSCGGGPAELDAVHGTVGGGAFLRLQEGLAIGVWTSDYSNATLNNAIQQMASVGAASNVGTVLADLDQGGNPDLPNRKFDLFAAYRLDPVVFGLHFTYGAVNYTHQDTMRLPGVNEDRQQDRFRESDIRIDAGVGVDLDDTKSLDGSVSYRRYGFDYVPNGEASLGDIANTQIPFSGGNGIALAARFRMELSDDWDLVPAASYSMTAVSLAEDSTIPPLPASGKRETLADAEEFSRKWSSHALDVGAAARLRAAERVRFWAATGIQYATTYAELKHFKTEAVDRTDSLTVSDWSLPYVRLALEAGLNDWLTFRGGAQKFVLSRTVVQVVDDRRDEGENDRAQTTTLDGTPTTTNPASPLTTFNTFSAFVGFGVFYHGLNVDIMLDPGFFFRGPEFISGMGGALATRVSVSYQF